MQQSQDYFSFSDEDENLHAPGTEPMWNESMAFCPVLADGSALLIRHGWRVNQGYVEASVARMNPNGTLQVMFKRSELAAAVAERTRSVAGGLELTQIEPRKQWHARFKGPLREVASVTEFADSPGTTLKKSPTVDCELDLDFKDRTPLYGVGPAGAMLGATEAVATRHYEASVQCTGTLTIGNKRERIDCGGMRDHSWGPRDLNKLQYSRWIWAQVGPSTWVVLWANGTGTHDARTGVIVRDGQPQVVGSVSHRSQYGAAPYHFTQRTSATFEGAGTAITVDVDVLSILPLYYEKNGRRARVVEYGCRVTVDGKSWPAWMEYIDDVVDGTFVGNRTA